MGSSSDNTDPGTPLWATRTRAPPCGVAHSDIHRGGACLRLPHEAHTRTTHTATQDHAQDARDNNSQLQSVAQVAQIFGKAKHPRGQ